MAVLYFAQGLPYAIFNDALPVYFRLHGVALAEIGLMSALGLPWALKFLWSPWVDRLATPRRWIVVMLGILAAAFGSLALFDAASPGVALWGILLAITCASATQDIAIDGATVRLLAPGEEGVGNGVRVTAYRVAIIVGGGALVMLSGSIPWNVLFLGAALLFLILAAVAARAPVAETARSISFAELLDAWWAWLRQEGTIPIFLFILLYKLGDAAMGPMVRPFWVDRGISPAEIGFVTTTLGMAATIAGALGGGIFVTRYGIVAGLGVLGLAQAFSNLGYAVVAGLNLGTAALYSASIFENFSAGLGTAAFLSFLMRICDRDHAVTQYACLSAIFLATRALAGVPSGSAVETLGYATYFALTFAMALPAFFLLPAVHRGLRARGRLAPTKLAAQS